MNSNIALSSLSPTIIALIVALVVLELGVAITALVKLAKTPNDRLLFGKKWPWALIIIFLMNTFIGPIIFFVAGRKPVAAVDPRGSSDEAPQADRAERAADVLYGSKDGE